jgi:two-component system chemotaxis response regulator CheB
VTPKIRVLVVDDSVVVRRLVSDVLADDPAIAVVGTASNGRVALARLQQTPADLVTLDIEMPDLDGLQTLAEIRKVQPRLPVIMFSTLTRRAASATIEALTLGANDYVTKPEGAGNLATARERIKEELIPKIKALCPQHPAVPRIRSTIPFVVKERAFDAREAVTAIAIGVSTGGPPALERLLGALPKDLAVPVFIVQHMPALFTTALATRLGRVCPLPVAEVRAPTLVESGHVYLARGDYHMVVERTNAGIILRNHQEAPENSCRPSVDVLFRSVAAIYGAGTLAVVLTGMGNDGQRSCEHVRAQGGAVLAQDQSSSVVWGMPGAVARAGLANAILPINEIAPEIVQRLHRGSLLRSIAQGVR